MIFKNYLVIGVSSRALFGFNRAIFRNTYRLQGIEAYSRYQSEKKWRWDF